GQARAAALVDGARAGREPGADLRALPPQGGDPGGRRRRLPDRRSGGVVDDPGRRPPRGGGLDPLRGVAGAGAAVDDAPPPPRPPEPGEARAGARLRPVSRPDRPRPAPCRVRALTHRSLAAAPPPGPAVEHRWSGSLDLPAGLQERGSADLRRIDLSLA